MMFRQKVIQRIEEASGYEQRVQEIATRVISTFETSNSEKKRNFDIADKIDLYGSHSLEKRLGGKAWKDFQKDVTKIVKAQIGRKMGAAGAAATRAEQAKHAKQVVTKIAHIINTAIGDTFPDGDPIDHIYPKAIRALNDAGIEDQHGDSYGRWGSEDISDWLDKASKENGFKNYHDQLKKTWDDYMADMDQSMKDAYPENPWS